MNDNSTFANESRASVNVNGITFISPADIAARVVKVAKVHQRQSLPFHAATSPLRRTGRRWGTVTLEWNSSAVTDMLVDSIVAIALRLDSNPLVAVKAEERETEESTVQDNRMKMLIKSKFILKKTLWECYCGGWVEDPHRL